MRGLTGEDILQIWETGASQHPIDRALTILQAGFPGLSRHELASLSIGQRDGYLLAFQELTFGGQLSAQTQCPSCGERMEFALTVANIQVDSISATNQPLHAVTDDGYELWFRLPDSLDLAAVLGSANMVDARARLVERCLIRASREDNEVPASSLPESAIQTLAEQMAAHDSQADVELALHCPVCEHDWLILFDILSYLWIEISVQARRLLHEVHRLAWAYGWREADILSLSTTRRQLYLEMIGT
jgi:hypothetical protein